MRRSNNALSTNRETILVSVVLVLILAFGLMLRVVAFAQSEVPQYPHGDAAKYFTYAYNLKNFGVYGMGSLRVFPATTDPEAVRSVVPPDAIVTPGLPVFLSLFLGGEHTTGQRDAILLTQVLLSGVTILLAFFAFLPVGKTLALGVALLTAFTPHLVTMNLHFLTEPLFTFLMLLFVFTLSRARTGSRAVYFLALGAILGLATLTRPWIQGYLFVLVAWFALSSWQRDWKKLSLVIVGAALLLSPWLIRNEVTLGYPADPSLSGKSILHGMYPNMMFEGKDETRGYAYKYDPMAPQLEKSTAETISELRRRAAADPATYLRWYLGGKTRTVLTWGFMAGADAIFVYPVGNSPYFRLPSFYLSSYYLEQVHGALMALALLGTLAVWLPRRFHAIDGSPLLFLRAVSLLVLYFLVMHSIGAPYPRYSVPMRPILYGLALYPLHWLVVLGWRRIRHGAPAR
jgi:hypothetical protein